MSNKQTSIEWFAEQLGIKSGTMLEQAKAMHKEEIIEAAIYEPFLGNYHRAAGEEYYEDEFGENQE